MAKYDYVLGIDPDVAKSGVALLDVNNHRFMKIDIMSFPELCEFMKDCLAFLDGQRLKVVVEGGWIVSKSNYHNAQGRRAEKIAKNVGENHGTGKQIMAMALHYGMDVDAIHPLKKCWKGRDGKITHKELVAVTGEKVTHTNQDGRDAALLAWVLADLPVRVPSED